MRQLYTTIWQSVKPSAKLPADGFPGIMPVMKSLIVIVGSLISIGLVASIVMVRWLQGPLLTQEINMELPEIEKDPETLPSSPVVTLVASNLNVPWAMAFTSNERMLVTERPGTIRAISNGEASNPLITFDRVTEMGEEGLMGMVLDPEYGSNAYLYVCIAEGNPLKVRVVKLKDEGERITEVSTLLDNIPAARFHAGCELLIAPDNTLLITTGDAIESDLAQNPDSLAGKILRINLDGSIPDNNPYPGSSVFSVGHRNPQGLTLGRGGILLSSEHGPSGFDGPGGGDEINLITPGSNYGWPLVSHEKEGDGLTHPLRIFTPAIAPGSVTYLPDTLNHAFKDTLLVAMLKGEGLLALKLSDDLTSIERQSSIAIGDLGRIREVILGLDNHIYFSTSNTDGRGSVRPNDDAIYQLRFE